MAKKRKKRPAQPAAAPAGMEYTDIGHTGYAAILWVLNYDGRLEKHSILHGTHNSIWGIRAMGLWRGRYDPASHTCSIVAPATYMGTHVPHALLEALLSEFSDPKMVDFNPQRRRR